jgi:DNA-binding ferritin-like protein
MRSGRIPDFGVKVDALHRKALQLGAKPIAAVREYMDEQRWREAEAQVPQVAQAIESAAAGIKKAAEDFENEMARGR